MPTLAAVDIGSNSVRLKIARLQAGRLRALHEDREVTRLGEGVFSSGFLTPDSMAETVKVLRRFHRTTQQIVTDSVRVVATSALRDARNSQAFLEWVRSATGWRVEIGLGAVEWMRDTARRLTRGFIVRHAHSNVLEPRFCRMVACPQPERQQGDVHVAVGQIDSARSAALHELQLERSLQPLRRFLGVLAPDRDVPNLAHAPIVRLRIVRVRLAQQVFDLVVHVVH